MSEMLQSLVPAGRLPTALGLRRCEGMEGARFVSGVGGGGIETWSVVKSSRP